MTLFEVDELDDELDDERTYCKDQEFPALVTEALIALRDHGGEHAYLAAAHRAWDLWGGSDGDSFCEAIEFILNEVCVFCRDCQRAVLENETTEVSGGDRVCDARCLDEYSYCESCSEYVADGTTTVNGSREWCDGCLEDAYRCYNCGNYYTETTTVGDDEFCEGCVHDYCNWCDNCEEYVRDGHTHECDCEAPVQSFQFPADGEGVVNQDERLHIELPKGTIDECGLQAIWIYLRDDALAYSDMKYQVWDILESIGPMWQAKRGNFPKRLSAALYKSAKNLGLSVKLSPEAISHIGNLARQYSSEEAAWDIEFTRNLNMPAGAFYNEGSCWWHGYAVSRCALKSWGGLAIRTFNKNGHVAGRAWIQPLKQADDGDLVPTHNTLGADAYVIYNGYGELSGYPAARIIAHLTGRTYKKIEYAAGEQYVNGDTGYLVADDATCENTDSLSFDYDTHKMHDAYDIRRAAA